MFKENVGGTIICSDLDGDKLPELFEKIAGELREHPKMRLESIRAIMYPTDYVYLRHGFTIKLELKPM